MQAYYDVTERDHLKLGVTHWIPSFCSSKGQRRVFQHAASILFYATTGNVLAERKVLPPNQYRTVQLQD